MQKILIATDFSPTSAVVLKFGTYLAEMMQLDLRIVHIFDTNFTFMEAVSTGAVEAKKQELQQKLAAFTKANVTPVFALNGGAKDWIPAVSVEVYTGFPEQQLRWLASSEDVAFVMLGGLGAGMHLHPPSLFGGVAKAMALKSTRPCLLVPPDYGFPELKKMAIAFDTAENLPVISGLPKCMVEALKPKVSFVHVQGVHELDEQEAVRQRQLLNQSWEELFPDYPYDFDLLAGGEVVDRLLRYTGENDIDLLVLGGKRRGFWEDLFQASHLKPIIRRCTIPLLIMPF
ncbi:MAG: universal stress protein [Bacteroidota bacterium]